MIDVSDDGDVADLHNGLGLAWDWIGAAHT
jgi:hypothetical protein